jgi:hypothetical protein
MRALLAALCLFCGSAVDVAVEEFDAAQRPKVERYRVLLSELTASGEPMAIKTATDLPDGLKEAIEAWTDS